MIIPTSPEFLALCQSQVLVLSQALGVTSTAIYLAEHAADQSAPTFIPVFAYPDQSEADGRNNQRYIAASGLPSVSSASSTEAETAASIRSALDLNDERRAAEGQDDALAEQQLVLPMAHEEVLLGVLICSRPFPWQEGDRQQAEQVANSLALACVMDQRGQWLQQQLQQKYLDQGQQSEHFHDLLHQFRNPLTAMRTFGKLLLRRMQPEDKNHGVAESIVRESERLQALVQQFDAAVAAGDSTLERSPEPPSTAALALPPGDSAASSALEGLMGKLSLEAVPVDEVLRPLLVSANAVAQERQIRMGQGLVGDLPPVWMDPKAMREVFSNLIDNALKYAPAGSWVWIATGLLKQRGAETYQGVAVGDTGPGIPTEDQAHVFERSYRGVQADGQIPGTGLGLAIAQDLVQVMGGSIDLYSPASLSGLVPAAAGDNQGPGSVFIVWLQQVDAATA